MTDNQTDRILESAKNCAQYAIDEGFVKLSGDMIRSVAFFAHKNYASYSSEEFAVTVSMALEVFNSLVISKNMRH